MGFKELVSTAYSLRASDLHLEAGTPLVVRLRIPQLDKAFIVSGLVHWVLPFSPSIEAPPGMGIALKPLAAKTSTPEVSASPSTRALNS